ncbi:DegQ family serine endoprotease [Niveibacterium sp. SC-1]|uniref:DegQ family serine endoprotease n=1 Tax=Niveibacterium sp. SC-1 TaxID=3135646 RepID=UPI00311D39D6
MTSAGWARQAWFVCLLLLAAPAAFARDLPDLAGLVEKFGPAVVNVSTVSTHRSRRDDEEMQDFLRRFGPRHPPIPRDEESESLGSGFIISADGYILTNAHVIESADEIVVRLVDKREFRARVIGADKRTDVAVIKIDATNLPRVNLGDPKAMRVGDWVLAIGSPFGFEHSVTAGIVSAKGRSLPDETLVPFIQTDVAINPGNSGGPLFNMKGEVIGVNSQIYSETGGFMGLSFAIPIDVAIDVHNQLRSTGKVTRGRVGVVIQEVTRDVADSFGLKNAVGALVSSVEKGGPADKAGVLVGDVILRFEGKAIEDSVDLPRVVGASRPGAKAVMQIWRQGAARDLSVVVAQLPDEDSEAEPVAARKQETSRAGNRLGLSVAVPTAEQKRKLKGSAALVVKEARGVAARAQLRTGDFVLAAVKAGEPVALGSTEQFNRFAAAVAPGESVSLLVRRGDAQSFVSLRAPLK